MRNKQPYIPIIANAIGADYVAKQIQTGLIANVSWLQSVYPIVNDGKREVNGSYLKVPIVYLNRNDYFFLEHNDHVQGLAFMVLNDPVTLLGDNKIVPIFTFNMSLVVFANLKAIDNTAAFDYHFEQYLVSQILQVFRGLNLALYVKNIFTKNINSILREFDVAAFDEKWFMYPFTAFRFDFSCNVGSECGLTYNFAFAPC